MKPPFSRKILMDWAGARVFREAQSLHNQRYVLKASYDPPHVSGQIARGNRPMRSGLKILSDGSAENKCPCYDNKERGIICSHVIAICLELLDRAHDPEREEKLREEARRARRLQGVDEHEYIQRVTEHVDGAVSAGLRIELAAGWREGVRSNAVPLTVLLEFDGSRHFPEEVSTEAPFLLTRKDESILFVLEDICEGPVRGRVKVPLRDFLNLLPLFEGKNLFEEDGDNPITVNAPRMQSRLKMDLDGETGELILSVHTELPHMRPGEMPVYMANRTSGWIYAADNFWPLERVLPAPLQGVYEQPVHIGRKAIPRFLQLELPVLKGVMPVDSDVSLDLFTIEPEDPGFRLVIRGSPASLSASLYAEYGEDVMEAGRASVAGHFAHPDPEDIMRYTVRNMDAERRALSELSSAGFSSDDGGGVSSIIGNREVMNFLGRDLPAFRRQGWKVELEGRIDGFMEEVEFALPVVNVGESGPGWFEVGFHFENRDGKSLSESDIRRALRRGESYVEQNGRTILLDADAIDSMTDVFEDCASVEGSTAGRFRMSDVYSAYVKSSLDALDGVDVEAGRDWRVRAEQQNRLQPMEPVELGEDLEGILRGYQKDGVSWLRCIEANGFGGILADEMGLGKTLQTLAWLQLERVKRDASGCPALIVCPTSLVGNWAEEARRFVPDLEVLEVTGSDRHNSWDKIDSSDLVITSYSLLRRDVDRYLAKEFSAVVLDEAQHIKNRSTQNAVSAKKLKAHHRVVLTGTPMENSVADLWSIMDFLMPGYLGSHDNFRQRYELPVSQGGPDGETAQKKLRRKLHPFLLRRLKRDVAKDLPPRIDRVAQCELSGDQQMVYRELLSDSRRRISDMVSKNGFQRSRMEILKTLMRLRQVCCHLDLLKLEGLDSRHPSEKLNLFFELLDEAMDGGHRVLVFSQFTSMLKILGRELDNRDLRYCYLDGSTTNRMAVVHEFNTSREIPVFLISLKAGGTGLNLTGADMVIHYDPWWNPAVEDQATDRAHRIGQKRTVYNVKLISRNTVEEKVLAMQRKKQSVISATLASDEQVMNRIRWEDVRELLDLE